MQQLIDVLTTHFRPKAMQITRFARTGFSFEEWFNWELFTAFASRGFQCTPKPAYRPLCMDSDAGTLGDLLIHAQNGQRYFIEVALVHGYTQNKWLAKIAADRTKLSTLNEPGLHRLQILVFCSPVEQGLREAWAWWFETLPFWHEASLDLAFSDGGDGEVAFRVWSVTGREVELA